MIMKYTPMERNCEQSENLLSIVEDINKNQPQLLKGSFDSDSFFTLLHKVKVDNISGYMERKQQRIEEKIQKRKGKKETDSCLESEDKKLKLS